MRVYVLSWAPAYDEASTGGFEWRRDWSEIQQLLADPDFMSEGCDYRVITLELPGMSDEEVSDFLASGQGSEVIDPPDPQEDLEYNVLFWREAKRA